MDRIIGEPASGPVYRGGVIPNPTALAPGQQAAAQWR
jgi:hypothetical protein